jgi:hypothetical protein
MSAGLPIRVTIRLEELLVKRGRSLIDHHRLGDRRTALSCTGNGQRGAKTPESSLGMIDRHYGHLARDSEDSIRARLDARSRRSGVYLASDGE